MKFYLGIDNSSDTVLTKKSCSSSWNHLLFRSVQLPSLLITNKNTPSDAESREEQNDGKHKFVGGTTAKLWLDFQKGVVINTEEKWIKPC